VPEPLDLGTHQHAPNLPHAAAINHPVRTSAAGTNELDDDLDDDEEPEPADEASAAPFINEKRLPLSPSSATAAHEPGDEEPARSAVDPPATRALYSAACPDRPKSSR
jgi:hypothetical protein